MDWNGAEPFAGCGRPAADNPASNRSRTVITIPPHRPDEASPIPTTRGSSGPMVTVGPGGHAFGNANAFVLGRNPDTVHALIASPGPSRLQPAPEPASSSARSFASSRAFVDP